MWSRGGRGQYYLFTGNPVKSFGLSAKDLEEDFDPASYDKTMMGVFNEEYYAGAGEGEEKPVFSDLEEELNGTSGSLAVHRVMIMFCSPEDCQAWMLEDDSREMGFNVSLSS